MHRNKNSGPVRATFASAALVLCSAALPVEAASQPQMVSHYVKAAQEACAFAAKAPEAERAEYLQIAAQLTAEAAKFGTRIAPCNVSAAPASVSGLGPQTSSPSGGRVDAEQIIMLGVTGIALLNQLRSSGRSDVESQRRQLEEQRRREEAERRAAYEQYIASLDAERREAARRNEEERLADPVTWFYRRYASFDNAVRDTSDRVLLARIEARQGNFAGAREGLLHARNAAQVMAFLKPSNQELTRLMQALARAVNEIAQWCAVEAGLGSGDYTSLCSF